MTSWSVLRLLREIKSGSNLFFLFQHHFTESHPGEHPFECDVCGHRATDEGRLKRHQLCHEPDRPKEYCNICFKEFRNKVSLRTHRNMVHKVGDKIYRVLNVV